MGRHETGGTWSKTGGACALRLRPKTATACGNLQLKYVYTILFKFYRTGIRRGHLTCQTSHALAGTPRDVETA